MSTDVMWSSLAWPGSEHVRCTHDGRWHADGAAVHALPGGPARVGYRVVADADGRTRQVSIEVTGRGAPARLVLSGDGHGGWTDAAGGHLPALDGCLDIDISCTPLTNTLPIRRLGLAVGESADLLVAYVLVPGLELSAQRQRYTRLPGTGSAPAYRYESGDFRADLAVDGEDLVVDYPGLWRRVPV
ncbi:hypothetical protein B0I33_107177 [Prauserella shujinwangii]|uniref:Glycolipid-binding protein n=1 Tax=Prauserella shujinwangii TaxID=1453103 RepID=A0A2T0LSF0_9PSEU|nr:putative glycolipid-binding domain-containing protein [Prauserella shujinwangii]PRX46600.1 hypothetical protein B0I33_107177 [Prauserella shujinwangii]